MPIASRLDSYRVRHPSTVPYSSTIIEARHLADACRLDISDMPAPAHPVFCSLADVIMGVHLSMPLPRRTHGKRWPVGNVLAELVQTRTPAASSSRHDAASECGPYTYLITASTSARARRPMVPPPCGISTKLFLLLGGCEDEAAYSPCRHITNRPTLVCRNSSEICSRNPPLTTSQMGCLLIHSSTDEYADERFNCIYSCPTQRTSMRSSTYMVCSSRFSFPQDPDMTAESRNWCSCSRCSCSCAHA